MATKDLEHTVKEKVTPLVEQTMQSSWGLSIAKVGENISDKLTTPFLDIYVSPRLNFSEAKKEFKRQFLKRELRSHVGNISSLAKELDVDRRSIHRVIKDLEINVDDVRKHQESLHKVENVIEGTIRDTLSAYSDLIQPHKMNSIYEKIPTLSRNIAKVLPRAGLTWKEAELEFEKEFLSHALVESEWNVSRAATKLQVRVETLHRKIKKLGLR